jgi:natural product biosynthesis luciferase-like monooxygenase protein
MHADQLEGWMIKRIAQELGIPPETIDAETPFSQLGLDSSKVVLLTGELSDLLGIPLDPTLTFEYPNIHRLAAYLASQCTGTSCDPLLRRPPMDFSLFFFADETGEGTTDRYQLLMDCARFAEENGFTGVWVPERHFHRLGGLYPNPVIIAAALASVTRRIRLRAGSVVLPLHDPIRVAEEWSMVDNLSRGRTEVSFASGWHVDDFVLAPDNYGRRKEILLERVETVRRLWRGEALQRRGGAGNTLQVRIHPRPVQAEIPVWLTAVGSPETYRAAGKLGLNLLTCLLSQDVEELETKLAVYRAGLVEGGFAVNHGKVCVFLHTYVGSNVESVREQVREPFLRYLETTLDLIGNFGASAGLPTTPRDLSPEDRHVLLDFAFERYFERRTLMGTPASCQAMVERLRRAGVAEIACLIDFGLSGPEILQGLEHLDELRKECVAR